MWITPLCTRNFAGQEEARSWRTSSAHDPDTLVIVGAREPEAQQKLFQRLFRKTGFD
jgi:hypothetical protein